MLCRRSKSSTDFFEPKPQKTSLTVSRSDPGAPDHAETPAQKRERYNWEEQNRCPKYGPYAGKRSKEYDAYLKQRKKKGNSYFGTIGAAG